MTAIRIIDSHLELADIGANDHHDEFHTIASHSDTSATGAQLDILTNNSIADTLHRHSELVASDGSPDPALSVDASGNVGIGTNSPSRLLEIDGKTVNSYIRLSNNDNTSLGFELVSEIVSNAAYIINRENAPLIFRTNNTEYLRIKSNGKVGIGTAAPATSALLDLTSTTGALLLTRMTTTQKNALTAVNGMVLYDSTLNKFQGRENGAWTNLI